jgi:large subunit ribosomal protein L10
MPRPHKVAEVELLSEKLKSSEGVVLADFTGLSVSQITELRRKCRESEVEFRVVKNRLAKRAAAAVEFRGLEDLLTGPTAIAFGHASPVEPAKVLTEFAKDHESFTIKGGFVDGEVIDTAGVKVLSDVPSRDELIAMIARGVNAPATGVAGSISAVMSSLARAIQAVAEQGAEAAA